MNMISTALSCLLVCTSAHFVATQPNPNPIFQKRMGLRQKSTQLLVSQNIIINLI